MFRGTLNKFVVFFLSMMSFGFLYAGDISSSAQPIHLNIIINNSYIFPLSLSSSSYVSSGHITSYNLTGYSLPFYIQDYPQSLYAYLNASQATNLSASINLTQFSTEVGQPIQGQFSYKDAIPSVNKISQAAYSECFIQFSISATTATYSASTNIGSNFDVGGNSICTVRLVHGGANPVLEVGMRPYTEGVVTATSSAYVADGSNGIWKCPLLADGTISSSYCAQLTNVTPNNFVNTSGITFATFSGVNYAYVADGTDRIWQCPIASDGSISGGACEALKNSTGSGFSFTSDIRFSAFSGVTYAYIADGSNTLWQCLMTSTGVISGGACTPLTNSPTPFYSISSATFATFSGSTYAYVSDGSSTLWQCLMTASGGISGGACAALTKDQLSSFNHISSVRFYTFSGVTYAYVADSSSAIWQCSMTQGGGINGEGCLQLTNQTAPYFIGTVGVTFATFSGVNYAYIADGSHNLWQCMMTSSGSIANDKCTALINTQSPYFDGTLFVSFLSGQ